MGGGLDAVDDDLVADDFRRRRFAERDRFRPTTMTEAEYQRYAAPISLMPREYLDGDR
jgi:hypothetical protein